MAGLDFFDKTTFVAGLAIGSLSTWLIQVLSQRWHRNEKELILHENLLSPPYFFLGGHRRKLLGANGEHFFSQLAEWNKKYGPFFKIYVDYWKNCIVISDLAAIKAILDQPFTFEKIGPNKNFHVLEMFQNNACLVQSEKVEHESNERTTFSYSRINKHELREKLPSMFTTTSELIKKWKTRALNGEVIEVLGDLNIWNITSILSALLGHQIEYNLAEKILKEISSITQVCVDNYTNTRPFHQLRSNAEQAKIQHAQNKLYETMGDLLDASFFSSCSKQVEMNQKKATNPIGREHAERPEDDKKTNLENSSFDNDNQLKTVLDAKESSQDTAEQKMKRESMIKATSNMLIMGSNAVSSAMAWLLYDMAKNPCAQQAIFNEISSLRHTETVLKIYPRIMESGKTVSETPLVTSTVKSQINASDLINATSKMAADVALVCGVGSMPMEVEASLTVKQDHDECKQSTFALNSNPQPTGSSSASNNIGSCKSRVQKMESNQNTLEAISETGGNIDHREDIESSCSDNVLSEDSGYISSSGSEDKNQKALDANVKNAGNELPESAENELKLRAKEEKEENQYFDDKESNKSVCGSDIDSSQISDLTRGEKTISAAKNSNGALLHVHDELYVQAIAKVSPVLVEEGKYLEQSRFSQLFSWDQINSEMPYLEAVIHESLRMHSPGGNVLMRRSLEDTIINNISIKRGTEILMPIGLTLRDESNFSNPYAFWPERWLIVEGKLPCPPDFKCNKNALILFGSGLQSCPGEELALLQLKVTLAALVQKFHFSLCGGHPEPIEKTKIGFSCYPDGLKINLTARTT